MLVNGKRASRPFLSQSLPSAMPTPSSASMDPLTDFFTAVERAYQRVQDAMTTAKTGYNLDVAQSTIVGGGGAQEWNNNAFSLLMEARVQGIITPLDASTLAQDVMRPLGAAIGKALEAITRGQDTILSYWDQFQNAIAQVISNSTGWVTKKWHDMALTYRLVTDYLASANAFTANIQDQAQSVDAKMYLTAYTIAIGKLTAEKTSMETLALSAGIPVAALQDQASKENVQALGLPTPTGILGTVIVGSITVGTVLKAIGTVIAIIGTGFLFAATDAVFALVGLENVVIGAKRKSMELEIQAKNQVDKATADAKVQALNQKEAATKKQIDSTLKTATGLAQVAGLQDQADALRAKVEAERRRLGAIEEESWTPWVLGVGGGLAAALIVYYVTHRKTG